jgi:GNAT superfamily N-acetyltransferase
MTDAIGIRAATPADAPELARLRYMFRSHHAPPSEPEAAFVTRAERWFATRLALPLWRGWVACAAEAIVGHAFLQLIEKIPNPAVEAEQIGYITNVFVLPMYRGAGVGGQLLTALLAACPPERVDTLILWPTDRSRPLYLRAGFAPPITLLERQC